MCRATKLSSAEASAPDLYEDLRSSVRSLWCKKCTEQLQRAAGRSYARLSANREAGVAGAFVRNNAVYARRLAQKPRYRRVMHLQQCLVCFCHTYGPGHTIRSVPMLVCTALHRTGRGAWQAAPEILSTCTFRDYVKKNRGVFAGSPEAAIRPGPYQAPRV